MDHLDDGAHALPLLAQKMRHRAGELDLRRGVRFVSQLVLQPHELDRVPLALEPAGNEEARKPAGGLGQRQEPVRHRRGTEPLVPGQPPGPVTRLGPGGVGPHVRAALFLGHRHAKSRARLLCDWPSGGIITAGGQLRTPHRAQLVRGRQRGDRGIGHRHRVAMAGLHLAREVNHRGVGHVPARCPVPGDAGIAGPDARLHQPVIGGVEAHLVQPPPAPVEEPDLGRMAVRLAPGLPHIGRAQHAGVTDKRLRPPAFAGNGLPQRDVGRPEIDVPPLGRLVGDLVGRKLGSGRGCHGQRLDRIAAPGQIAAPCANPRSRVSWPQNNEQARAP